jgi:GTP-binding protein Era
MHKSGFVAILGKPNVGKSTLVNALVGEKVAIVSDKPQTTRTKLLGVLTKPDAQVIFIDTPGVHQPKHRLGQAMMDVARQTVPDADVLVFLVDVSKPPSEEDEATAKLVTGGLVGVKKPCLLVGNKADKPFREKVDAAFAAYRALGQFDAYLLISALKKKNLDLLLEAILERLPEGPPYYPEDAFTDQPSQGIAAELIREQVLHVTRQEVPHGVAVVVDEWKQRRPDLTDIAATIFVEKESHKAIIIGKGGEVLKKIGAAARPGIEALAGNQVFLQLWVKVADEWRDDQAAVKRFGYGVTKE